jgi:hypothetical protein
MEGDILDHPSQIFSRIRRLKARPTLFRHEPHDVAPAPIQTAVQAPACVPPQPPAASTDPLQSPVDRDLTAAPATPVRPARGHALYSQVMRRHDRAGARHL